MTTLTTRVGTWPTTQGWGRTFTSCIWDSCLSNAPVVGQNSKIDPLPARAFLAVTSFFDLYFPSLLSFTAPYPISLHPIRLFWYRKSRGSRLSDPLSPTNPEALEQPRVKVSGKVQQ